MKRVNQGFTLIELLVAMSLLATIMLLGSWSFSTFTAKWQGRLGHFSESVSQTKDYILLNNIISSIIPYVYKSHNKITYYFNGDKSSFKAVSLGAIFNTKSAVNFKVEVKQHTDGSYFLLYQEGKLKRLTSASISNYSHEKILIAKANDIHFQYFAWHNIQEKMNSEELGNTQLSPKWLNKYNSENSSLMPMSVRIVWDDNFIDIPLINDQGQWLNIITTSGVENGV